MTRSSASTWLVSVFLVASLGCKKQEATPTEPAPSVAAPAPAPAPAAPTGAAIAQRYVDCWGFLSAKDWASFQTCYAPGIVSDFVDSGMPPVSSWDDIQKLHNLPLATAFPDAKGTVELTLVNGSRAVTIALLTGTQTGPLVGPGGTIPPTGKRIGVRVAHAVEWAPDGKAVVKEQYYQDMGQMLAQLGVSPAPARPAVTEPWKAETVIASDAATEKRNLDVVNQAITLFNQHELVWAESGVPVDWNHDAAIAAHDDLFKGFSDLKIEVADSLAAGAWVVQKGQFIGTNDGDVASMGLKKTGKKLSIGFLQLWKVNPDGKIAGSWGFWNSAAFAMQLGLGGPPPKAATP
jgi:predicted ester cyclase